MSIHFIVLIDEDVLAYPSLMTQNASDNFKIPRNTVTIKRGNLDTYASIQFQFQIFVTHAKYG